MSINFICIFLDNKCSENMSIYLQEKKDICGPHVLINQNPSYQVLFQKKI